jgi:WD40 repeat protein
MRICALQGHTSFVYGVAISGDNLRIASSSGDKTIKIWDSDTGKLDQTLRGHTGHVTCVDLSMDGKVLVSGGGKGDRTVNVWDLEDIHAPVVRLRLTAHTDVVWAVKISPDGMKIASASLDKTVMIWSIQSGKQLLTFKGHKDKVYAIAWSPDSKFVASGGRETCIFVWEAETGIKVREPLNAATSINCVAFDSTASMLVTGGFDNRVVVWELPKKDRAVVKYRMKGHSDAVETVALSPDGQFIVSGSRDDTLRVWDVATGKVLIVLEGHAADVNSVAWSRDGMWILSGSWDRTVCMWGMDEQVCVCVCTYIYIYIYIYIYMRV